MFLQIHPGQYIGFPSRLWNTDHMAGPHCILFGAFGSVRKPGTLGNASYAVLLDCRALQRARRRGQIREKRNWVRSHVVTPCRGNYTP